jgi:hypothetical protein
MRSRQAPNAFVISETVNGADFTDYHRFGADSRVTFEGGANSKQ